MVRLFRGAAEMKRIGLYLGVDPTWGGQFQYSQGMLDALASLPRGEFEPVVAYSSETWRPYLETYELQKLYVRPTRLTRLIVRAWSRLRLPVALWRAAASRIDPFSRAFVRARCRLWIFPTRDGAAYRLPVPALAVIHDLMHRYETHFPEVSAHGEFRRRERVLRSICRWAQALLVDSEVGKRQVQESYGVEADRIYVLPFVAPPYTYSEKRSTGFDERHQLPMKFLFYPAHFWEHKNHSTLIRAAKRLQPRLPQLRLVFVGSKQNGYQSCVRLVRELGLEAAVSFLGYVPDEDMPELYRRARAMIMPTFFGPTNIPPLEAFAIGCPAAVSNVYGMPEQVGDAALLFDPRDEVAIADVIYELWTDDQLCADLIRRGKKRAAQWGHPQFQARLVQILRAITGGAESWNSVSSGS